jgi:hypothetical protein
MWNETLQRIAQLDTEMEHLRPALNERGEKYSEARRQLDNDVGKSKLVTAIYEAKKRGELHGNIILNLSKEKGGNTQQMILINLILNIYYYY